ncbi:unnamed protein product [Enterobius vermicularis]|uniref:Uncharacterized protein n=1 Tax=Enterobius vermicularis TaxID=51028 RepID=A0A0N4UXZ5_ENTVE|nr:unnamed protein product [Enterobius vermicularis]
MSLNSAVAYTVHPFSVDCGINMKLEDYAIDSSNPADVVTAAEVRHAMFGTRGSICFSTIVWLQRFWIDICRL